MRAPPMCRKPVGEGANRVTTSAPVASVAVAVKLVSILVATKASFTQFAAHRSGDRGAPSMATRQLQTPNAVRWGGRWQTLGDAIEERLEEDR
ncbi:hypothetical protein GCM10011393_20590 [Sphingopyxis bauzanensis]|nr:hypothetical protein GCM10011393_20590 [Sphingopyxis bauzanensis]